MKVDGLSVLRGVKYALTSASTFSINLFLVWFCASMLGVHYLAAVGLGFVVETTLLYVLNRVWTFRGIVDTTVGVGYARAWLVALSTFTLILVFEWILVSRIGLHYLLARIFIAPLAYAWSLFWDGTFTFRAFKVIRQQE